MRLRAAALATSAALAAAAAPAPPAPQTIQVAAAALPLDPADPRRTRVGALEYVWGARMSARGTSRFGGLSGLEAKREGSRVAFTAVTDDGDVVRWSGSAGRPPEGRAAIRPLLDTEGRVPSRKSQRDAEDLTEDGDGFLVSFEGRHRVWRYDGFAGPAAPAAAPIVPGMRDNLGFEALAVLAGPAGGTTAVGAEDGRLWLCPRATQRCRLALRGPPEFGWWLTGLDTLPGTGDLVGLYRFYNPFTKTFSAMLAYLPVRDGAVRVLPLARLSGSMNVDNFEGVSAVREGSGYRLFIVSDDDFSPARRTLLLAFDWRPDGKGPASPPAPSR